MLGEQEFCYEGNQGVNHVGKKEKHFGQKKQQVQRPCMRGRQCNSDREQRVENQMGEAAGNWLCRTFAHLLGFWPLL